MEQQNKYVNYVNLLWLSVVIFLCYFVIASLMLTFTNLGFGFCLGFSLVSAILSCMPIMMKLDTYVKLWELQESLE